jgi:hypothetical protein
LLPQRRRSLAISSEPVLSELLVHAASPRPFAVAVSFAHLAADLPSREWRDVALPRYETVRRTPAYQSARSALANACDAMGYAVARGLIVTRAAEVARSIDSIEQSGMHRRRRGTLYGLSATAARRALTAAAPAVWPREQLAPEQVAVLHAPLEAHALPCRIRRGAMNDIKHRPSSWPTSAGRTA